MAGVTLARWPDLQRLANFACREFDLRPKRIEPIVDLRDRAFGRTDANGVVRIRVHVIGQPTRMLRWATIVDTLAHELAHTDEAGWRHGNEHRELSDLILEAWRKHKAMSRIVRG
jgi:predicted metal-dependent hydrolase